MLTLTKTLSKPTIEAQQEDSGDFPHLQQIYFLQEVLESLQDGILLLTEKGEIIHANASAYQICSQLNPENLQQNFVPQAIRKLCESLIETKSLFPKKQIILSDEIVLDNSNIFRVRVRWMDLERLENPCLLVTIENRYESVKNVALVEVKKYDLTPREAEIWFLYRSSYSYKDIAAKLYISINTVKKHMKSIHAKRQAYLDI